jgi:large subunit ribosomal protein L4
MAKAKTVSVKVVDMAGNEVEKLALDASVFGIEPNYAVVKDAIVVYNANLRQATAKTKKRDEVSGGGKKPWRQKGTGRARAGSTRSPIWVGGGTVWGPTGEQSFKLSQNKKEHKLAMKSLLSEKVSEKKLIVVDALKFDAPKTKEFVKVLDAVKAEGKVLLVLDNDDANVVESARNVARVGITGDNNVAVYDLAYFDTVLVTKEAIKKIEGGLK